MKILSKLLKKGIEEKKPKLPVLCLYQSSPWGIIPLEKPTMSDEKTCDYCGGKDHLAIVADQNKSAAKTWLCTNRHCKVTGDLSGLKPTMTITQKETGILWPLFCESNGIGDLHYGVKFENMEHSEAKVSAFLKFATNPQGIILLRGDTGTGKSYCAMACCELFTRTNTSAIFISQWDLERKWLDTFKENDIHHNFINQLMKTQLLVIDDFGLSEPAAGFMKFFMELIDCRSKWSNRGTVITTNLDNQMFNKYCGQALSDRILTGSIFEFKGPTKRKPTIL